MFTAMHTPAPDTPEDEHPAPLPASCYAGGEISPGALSPSEQTQPGVSRRSRRRSASPHVTDTRLRARITPTSRGEEGTSARIHELRERREQPITPFLFAPHLATNIIPPTPGLQPASTSARSQTQDIYLHPQPSSKVSGHESHSNPPQSRRSSPAEDEHLRRQYSAPPDASPFSSRPPTHPYSLPDVPPSFLQANPDDITIPYDANDPFLTDQTVDTDAYEAMESFDDNPLETSAATSLVPKTSKGKQKAVSDHFDVVEQEADKLFAAHAAHAGQSVYSVITNYDNSIQATAATSGVPNTAKRGGKPKKVVSDDFEVVEQEVDKLFAVHAAHASQTMDDVIAKYVSRKKGCRAISLWNIYQKFWKVNRGTEDERAVRGLREGETIENISADTLRARAWERFQVEEDDWEQRLSLFHELYSMAGSKSQTYKQRSTSFEQYSAKVDKYVCRRSLLIYQCHSFMFIQANAIYTQYGFNTVWIIVGEDRLRASGETPGASGVCQYTDYLLDVTNVHASSLLKCVGSLKS